MSVYAYMFEVRGIQSFLFSSGKLKDLVSGSELIDFLCKQPLQEVLKVCGLEHYDSQQHSPRCAGGSFYLLIENRESADRLKNIWPLVVEQLLPGVEQVSVLSEGETAKQAISAGLNKLRSARNYIIPQLPAAGPVAQRNPRTGNVAVVQKAGESLDLASHKKRQFTRPQSEESLSLAARFSENRTLKWPDNFEASGPLDRRFPMENESHVAIVHADGNGLGEVLRVVNSVASTLSDADYIKLYRSFSDGLEKATVRSCQIACREVLEQHAVNDVVPARPIVLGGDDLTLIVRADLALNFTQAFANAFEVKTKEFLQQLNEQIKQFDEEYVSALPDYLSVCAGLSFIKPSQPFAQSYQLAESLCDQAKKMSRHSRKSEQDIIPSSLSFHWVQSTLIEDAESLFIQEKVAHGLHSSVPDLALGFKAYRIGQSTSDDSTLPELSDLMDITKLLVTSEGLNQKRLRKLATLLHLDRTSAEREYARWRELASQAVPQELEQFDSLLHKILGSASNNLPADMSQTQSPLADLLVLEKVIDSTQGVEYES